jgi:dTDP-4-dehydrorhamnose 3,5-epimerase
MPYVWVAKLIPNEDERGMLIELFREDAIANDIPFANLTPKMGYYSVTKSGVIRGPHAHQMQTDIFVFVGPGEFELHLWHQVHLQKLLYHKMVVGESNPMAVVVTPGVIHGYKCISESPGVCFNFPNQLYKGWGKVSPVDETRYEERSGHQYIID